LEGTRGLEGCHRLELGREEGRKGCGGGKMLISSFFGIRQKVLRKNRSDKKSLREETNRKKKP